MNYSKFELNEFKAKALSSVASLIQSRIEGCQSSIDSYNEQIKEQQEQEQNCEYLYNWRQAEIEEKALYDAMLELLEKKLVK